MSKKPYETKFSVDDAEEPTIVMAVVRKVIRDLIRDKEVYREVERHLSEPGVTGRSSWDRCLSVQVLLEADANADGFLTTAVDDAQLTLLAIGDQLIKTLRTAGLVITQGRIVGMLEYDEE